MTRPLLEDALAELRALTREGWTCLHVYDDGWTVELAAESRTDIGSSPFELIAQEADRVASRRTMDDERRKSLIYLATRCREPLSGSSELLSKAASDALTIGNLRTEVANLEAMTKNQTEFLAKALRMDSSWTFSQLVQEVEKLERRIDEAHQRGRREVLSSLERTRDLNREMADKRQKEADDMALAANFLGAFVAMEMEATK